jgi:small multidrug resistance pump
MSWLFLIGAILTEVAATLALRMGSQPGAHKIWFLGVGAGYLAAFAFLALTLGQGIAIGVAYGIWAASGVALTALASRVLFDEPLTKITLGGIAMIIAGVLSVELATTH